MPITANFKIDIEKFKSELFPVPNILDETVRAAMEKTRKNFEKMLHESLNVDQELRVGRNPQAGADIPSFPKINWTEISNFHISPSASTTTSSKISKKKATQSKKTKRRLIIIKDRDKSSL